MPATMLDIVDKMNLDLVKGRWWDDSTIVFIYSVFIQLEELKDSGVLSPSVTVLCIKTNGICIVLRDFITIFIFGSRAEGAQLGLTNKASELLFLFGNMPEAHSPFQME